MSLKLDIDTPAASAANGKKKEEEISKRLKKNTFRLAFTFTELACTLGGLTQRDVARRLGTMTEHGVGKQRGLVRAALAGDARLRAEFDDQRDRINSRL
jgi:hypothetical protein